MDDLDGLDDKFHLPLFIAHQSHSAKYPYNACPMVLSELFVLNPVLLETQLSGVVDMRIAHEPPLSEDVFLYCIESGRPSRPKLNKYVGF